MKRRSFIKLAAAAMAALGLSKAVPAPSPVSVVTEVDHEQKSITFDSAVNGGQHATFYYHGNSPGTLWIEWGGLTL